MKRLHTVITIALAIICIALLYRVNNPDTIKTINDTVVLIWNDDVESIPPVGQFVKVEMILGNEIYLTPIN